METLIECLNCGVLMRSGGHCPACDHADQHSYDLSARLASAIERATESQDRETSAGDQESAACYSRIANDLRRLAQDVERVRAAQAAIRGRL